MKEIKEKFKQKVSEEIDKIDADAVKNGTKTLAKEATDIGVETVKSGVNGIINGLLAKLFFFFVVVVLLIGGSCVGTNYIIDANKQTLSEN